MRTVVIRSLLLSSVLVCSLDVSFSQAAFTSSITPDGTLGTTVTPTQTQAGKVFDINGGTIKGTNQFHSFGLFSVGTGDTASFNGPAGILNILSRVTGGQQSQIDGSIKSTISGANLYLMNPAGVLFGPNASLDLSGSFHVTTADYLRLTDNTRFNAVSDAAKDALLTTAPVAAFGFLSNSPASIVVGETDVHSTNATPFLDVPIGQTISLVGGDITINNSLIRARHGRVNLASVASSGEVIPNVEGESPALDVSSFSDRGMITESFSNITTSSPLGAGTIVIRGGSLLLGDFGSINSNTNGDISGNPIGVDINVTGDVVVSNGSQIQSFTAGAGQGSNLLITAGKITVKEDPEFINQNTTVFDSFIQTVTGGTGNAGDITLRAQTVEIINQAYIGARTVGAGKGGTIDVMADQVEISAPILKRGPARFTADAGMDLQGGTANGGTSGDGGTIRIKANTMELTDGGNVRGLLFGSGHGPSIELNVKTLIVDGSSFSNTINGNQSGLFGSAIQTQLIGTTATGDGGNITITAEDAVKVTNHGFISSALFNGATGNAGNITVKTGTLEVSSSGYIAADATLGAGNAGTLNISAGTVRISGANLTERALSDNFSGGGLFTSTNAGRGGDLVIKTGDLLMTDRGVIASGSLGSGAGGTISITGNNIVLNSEAIISAQSSNTGRAGDIHITATDGLLSRDGSITTEARQADGGNIDIQAGNIVHLVRSDVTTSVGTGKGSGGNISIDPQFLILDHSHIIANAFEGNGGNINITAGVFLADPSSTLSASSALGVNGTIQIQSPVQNLSGSLSPLPSSLLKIAPLTSQCTARAQGGSFSSFTVAGRDGVPAEPGGLLPSPLEQASVTLGPSPQASTSGDQGLPVSVLLSRNFEGRCGE